MLSSFFKNLLFPVECLNCRRTGHWLCSSCFKLLKFGCPAFNLNNLKITAIDKVFIAGDYEDGLLATLIKKYKYNFIKDLGQVLGSWLSIFWAGQLIIYPSAGPQYFSVLAIPLAPSRNRWRGFNQAEALAKCLQSNFGYTLNTDLLRIQTQAEQASLDAKQRIMNVQNSFVWSDKNPPPENIILIDDVITTGSTLNEAANCLKKAGAKKIYALVLAKG